MLLHFVSVFKRTKSPYLYSYLTLGCPSEFASARMLYCDKECGSFWIDKQDGCQQADADAFCRLTQCNDTAYAEHFDIINVKPVPGFSCAGVKTNYGPWFGLSDVHFTQNMEETHGSGNVVSNVKCRKTCTLYYL